MSSTSPEGFRYQTHSVVSFRAYEAGEKVKLKIRYPFLSADQINRKLKQQWNQLQKSEQKCFTKKCIKLTPIKDTKMKHSPARHRTKDVTKTHKSTTKQRSKKLELNVCDTPEYVNPQKLKDFRNQHDEKYSSDFFSSTSNRATDSNNYKILGLPVSPRGTPEKLGIFSTSNSPMDDLSIENYNSSSMGDENQESSDEESAVLLKRTDTGDITDGYNFKDDTDDEYDNVLIKRDVTEYTKSIDENSQQIDDVTIPLTTNNDYDATKDKKRKHETDHQEQSYSHKIKKPKLDDDANVKFKSPGSKKCNSEEQVKSILNTSQDSNNNSFKSPLLEDTRNLRKTRRAAKSTSSTSSPVSSSAFGPKNLGPNTEIDIRTTKSMISMTPIIGTNVEIDKPSVSSMTPVFGHNLEKRNTEVTPAVGINLNQEEYYTPLMNEELHQSTLNEAGKAPHKKKMENDNIENNDKIKAAIAGRRVTKSLMTKEDELEIQAKVFPEADKSIMSDKKGITEIDENVLKNEPTRKQARRKSLRKKSVDNQDKEIVNQKRKDNKRKSGKENIINTEFKSTPGSDLDDFQFENKLQRSVGKSSEIIERKNCTRKANKKINSHMNPSGDACNVDREKVAQESHGQNNGQTNESSKIKATSSVEIGNITNASGEFSVEDSPRYLMSDMCKSQESTDSQSTASSQTSIASMDDAQSCSNTTKKQKMNPTLLRAIDCLRLTTVTGSDKEEADDWQSLKEEESDSYLSSPRLLSPALSGISELSSLSSGSSKKASTDKASQDNLPRKVTIRTIAGETKNDLCKMFADVTPPDRKTKGAYKTQRILQSGNPNRGNFKQLFKDDEDFIFS